MYAHKEMQTFCTLIINHRIILHRQQTTIDEEIPIFLFDSATSGNDLQIKKILAKTS